MLSPILRTYENPDESDKVGTFNMPHVMFYAPNVTNEDIGGKLQSEYPFVIIPGPHGYIIQAMGQAEKANKNREYEAMLNRLCGIKEEWLALSIPWVLSPVVMLHRPIMIFPGPSLFAFCLRFLRWC
jgi:hypothetical protein